MKDNEFKVRPNIAVFVFLAAILISGIVELSEVIGKSGQISVTQYVLLVIFIAAMFFYFLGCRPYRYIVDDKTVICKRRLIPDRKIDLVHAEVIADPTPKMSDLVTRPHAIELYMDDKKKYKFFPVNAGEFTGAILSQNKRIHCTVKAYTDIHRSIEKRERKQRKKEERRRRRSQE